STRRTSPPRSNASSPSAPLAPGAKCVRARTSSSSPTRTATSSASSRNVPPGERRSTIGLSGGAAGCCGPRNGRSPASPAGREEQTRMRVCAVDFYYYQVAEMERAIAFYEGTLGLRLAKREGPHWTEFAVGAATLVLAVSPPEHSRPPGSGTVALAV